jgi:hypothetical protein
LMHKREIVRGGTSRRPWLVTYPLSLPRRRFGRAIGHR